MTYNKFLELDYWGKRRELDRLIAKRCGQSANLTRCELKCYEVATNWYNDTH